MKNISSKNNIIIKELVKLRDDYKYKDEKKLFYVEGERAIKDTPSELISDLFILDEKFEDYKYIAEKINSNNIYVVNPQVYSKIKDTTNSQGIIATVKYNLIDRIYSDVINKTNTCVVLDSIKDPGNLGTILRISEAAKVSLVIISSDSCHIYNNKVVRASMSSIFRSNIYISNDIINDIKTLSDNGFNIYATTLDKSANNYCTNNYTNKSVFVFGNEANGVRKDILNFVNNKIYIPMCGNIESLNVSVSTAIVLYEVMRQNHYYET